jgi:hypothetical protein
MLYDDLGVKHGSGANLLQGAGRHACGEIGHAKAAPKGRVVRSTAEAARIAGEHPEAGMTVAEISDSIFKLAVENRLAIDTSGWDSVSQEGDTERRGKKRRQPSPCGRADKSPKAIFGEG